MELSNQEGELTEEELDQVLAGVPRELAIEAARNYPNLPIGKAIIEELKREKEALLNAKPSKQVGTGYKGKK